MADHLQAGGIRILQVLHDPHPPALIEVEEHRLCDDRLGEHLVDFQIVGRTESLQRLERAERFRVQGCFTHSSFCRLCGGRLLGDFFFPAGAVSAARDGETGQPEEKRRRRDLSNNRVHENMAVRSQPSAPSSRLVWSAVGGRDAGPNLCRRTCPTPAARVTKRISPDPFRLVICRRLGGIDPA